MCLVSFISGLLSEVILPVLMGLLLQHYWRTWAKRNSGLLAKFDEGVILLIVYSSFPESFLSNVFQTIDPMYLLSLFIAVSAVVLWGVWNHILPSASSSTLQPRRSDPAVFCESKKSLTHGSVFAKFLFANDPRLGLLVLPLMISMLFKYL